MSGRFANWLVAVAGIGLAGTTYGVPVLQLDMQSVPLTSGANEPVTTVQPGFQAFEGDRSPAVNAAKSHSYNAGANTVTLTPKATVGVDPRLASRNKGAAINGFDPGEPGYDIYRDFIRATTANVVQNGTFTPGVGYGGQEDRPVMQIDVTGLAASTAYNVTIYSWHPPVDQPGQANHSLTGINGTGGGTNNFVVGSRASAAGEAANPFNSPEPTSLDTYAFTYQYTTNSVGLLSLDFAFLGPTVADVNNKVDPQVVLNGLVIDVVPEPAVASMLVVGGLLLCRRRGA